MNDLAQIIFTRTKKKQKQERDELYVYVFISYINIMYECIYFLNTFEKQFGMATIPQLLVRHLNIDKLSVIALWVKGQV